jgi:hypothetical protein
MKKVFVSSEFYVPAIIVFVAVTILYWMKYDQADMHNAGLDGFIYWLTYTAVMLFLQYVIYVHAKRLLHGRINR